MSDDPEPVAGKGDHTTAGPISNSEGIAIGRNARVEINRYGDIIVRVDSLEELPPTPGKEPYKGLTYYTEDDRGIFFGREQLSDDLAARLATTAFLVVAGASGSGKSSLLRAGVIPRLRQRNWAIHILTPTANPLSQLANSLTHDDPALSAADDLRIHLATDPQTLRRAAEKRIARADAARLLLVVDQFEELFTQCRDEAARRAFIDNLLAAAQDDGRITILIGLRADFTGRLTDVEPLRVRAEQNLVLLGPMQQEDLVRVIAEPARIGGWAFVNGLVEQFLRDAGQEPGRLPLLSHALLETWKRRSSHVMTLKGYREAGGVDGAIARTAEGTLERLEPQVRSIAQTIFLALTELGEEGAEDTRRIARHDELARAGDPAAVDRVLDTLAAARLVMIDDKGVEVAHEALIRRWPRLREWLADSRERLRFERQLEEDACEWQAFNRDPGALYRGARLAQAKEWRAGGHKLTDLSDEFLTASVIEVEREAAERERAQQEKLEQAQRLAEEATAREKAQARATQEALEREKAQARAARTFKRAVVIAGILATVAGTLAFLAFFQRNQTILASDDGQARLLSNLSKSNFENDPMLSNRLLLEAATTAGSDSVRKDVAADLARNLAGGRINDPYGDGITHFTDVLTGTLYIVHYRTGEDELLLGSTGRAAPALSGYVEKVMLIPDSPYFLIDYLDSPGELRRLDTGEPGPALSEKVSTADILPGSNYFVVRYTDSTAELRRSDTGELGFALDRVIENSFSIPRSRHFVLDFLDTEEPDELRRIDTGEPGPQLTGDVFNIYQMPDSPYFVINYSDTPDEFRLLTSGEAVSPFDLEPHPDGPTEMPSDVGPPSDIGQPPSIEPPSFEPPPAIGQPPDIGPPPAGAQPPSFDPSPPAEEAPPALNGEDLWETGNGLYGVLPIPGSRYYLVVSPMASSELRRIDTGESGPRLMKEPDWQPLVPENPFQNLADGTGEPALTESTFLPPLGGKIYGARAIPGSNFFVIDYKENPGGLHSKETGELIFTLNGEVNDAFDIPESPYFVISYRDRPGQFQGKESGEAGPSLTGEVNGVIAIPGSPYFFVGYVDAMNELRHVENGNLGPALSGNVVSAGQIPGSPFFIVNYTDGPGEIRYVASGEVVTDANGDRIARKADVLRANDGLYLMYYQDGTSEIVHHGNSLIDLGRGAEQSITFPAVNRVLVRYGDGRVTFIDLDLIEVIGGADAEETLAAMTPEELVTFTCDTLFTDNPDWDETKLEAYLAFLPDGEPRACGQ